MNYSAENTFTITGLDSLANSATAGWGSGVIDNITTDKFIDALLDFKLVFANTAPANNKAVSLFAFGGTNATDVGTTGATTGGVCGTVGALTFPSIATLPNNLKFIGNIEHPANFASDSQVLPVISIAEAAGWRFLPPYWGIALVNYSGAALGTGNAIKWRGITI